MIEKKNLKVCLYTVKKVQLSCQINSLMSYNKTLDSVAWSKGMTVTIQITD